MDLKNLNHNRAQEITLWGRSVQGILRHSSWITIKLYTNGCRYYFKLSFENTYRQYVTLGKTPILSI